MKKNTASGSPANQEPTSPSKYRGRLLNVIGSPPVNHGEFSTFDEFIDNYTKRSKPFPDLSKIIGKL